MKIVLLGYMGSGKSTVGQLLARKKGLPFLDLDAFLEERLNMDISAIFKKKGEIYFRKMERQLLAEALEGRADMVIALGGGTPSYGDNLQTVLSHTPGVVYLSMSVPALAARLKKEKAHRPLIRDIADDELPAFIGKHLFERLPFYIQAPYTVNCDGKEAKDIVREIESLLF